MASLRYQYTLYESIFGNDDLFHKIYTCLFGIGLTFIAIRNFFFCAISVHILFENF